MAQTQDDKKHGTRAAQKLFAGAALAGAAAAYMTAGAQAQSSDAPQGYSSASGLDGVRDVIVHPDGRVELVMDDGRRLMIEAADVQLVDGVVYVADSAVHAALYPASETGSSGGGAGILLGVLGGAGLLGAAAGGGGGGGGGGSTPTPPANRAPSFTSDTTANFAENGTGIAYDANATDADGDALTYSISGGADAALFTIDAATGEVSFAAAPDFENPGDADGDNVYEITVQVSDGTLSATRTVRITVTDENEFDPVITSASTATTPENAAGVVYTATASDDDGASTLTYSIAGGADAALFSIDATTGEVRFVAAPDFDVPGDADGDNVYDIIIEASDGSRTDTQTVSIAVTDVDEAPAFTSGDTASVGENTAGVVYTAEASDPENGALTYGLTGTDAALFTIDAATGEVRFRTAPDFENPGDADGDNVYDVTVTASDGTTTVQQAVAINVTDVNEFSPTFTSGTAADAEENQTIAYVAQATDLDGSASLTYSLDGSGDAALFKIDSQTGVVTFVDAPDYEAPGVAPYTITVIASDGTNSVQQTVTVTVTNVNERPVITSAASTSVNEGSTDAYRVQADDPDQTAPTYAISGGADASLFTIDPATGQITFIAAPDFENPADADGDNIYEITVTATDGEYTDEQTVTIRVANLNDNAPGFTSATSTSVVEGTLDAYDADASDADGDALTYSLSGGADSALFTIDSTTGLVSFINAPDFENPADADGDNDYEITIEVSDGTNVTQQTVTISVTDGNDNAPAFVSGSAVSVNENETLAYTANATDPDGDTVTYAIAGGADAALFTIDETTGQVSFVAAPDFENPGDAGGNNVYDIIVRASDGSNTTDQAVAITVNDLNDNAPVFSSAAAASVEENQTAAYTAVATDADAGASITYSLSGTDAALFTIDETTGVVRFRNSPDFENPADAGGDNVYDVTVTASDGTNTTDQNVAITVTDVNEAGGDVPADQSTSVNLSLGSTYDGELETVGDRDWIRVELTAGQRYAISLTGSGGSPLSDPLVRLYDADGNLVAENDDGGAGLNSLLTYTIENSGTYYIEAAAWDDTVAGSYTVGLEEADPLPEFTNDQIADFLRSGYWEGATRRFDASAGDTLTVDVSGLTAGGQFFARAALSVWTEITGLNFQEVIGGAQITFDDEDEGAYATSVRQGQFIISSEINVSTDWIAGDLGELDSYSFQTYIHEIGHAIGLGHAGPYNGSASYGVDAIYLNDSWQATVMSYFNQLENTFIQADGAYVVTPQVADILAVQAMYGITTTTRVGDTTYGFNANAGNVVYDATNGFTSATSYTIIDSGGIDTLDYSGYRSNQFISLETEVHMSIGGIAGNVAIARGTVIENAIGGSGDDVIYGNAANNTLSGNDGNDTFYSSGGIDSINGGAGTDTVIFSGLASDYTATTNGGVTTVVDNRAGSPDGTTTLTDIESIQYGGGESGTVYLPGQFSDPDAGYQPIDWENLQTFGSCSSCGEKHDHENHNADGHAFDADPEELAQFLSDYLFTREDYLGFDDVAPLGSHMGRLGQGLYQTAAEADLASSIAYTRLMEIEPGDVFGAFATHIPVGWLDMRDPNDLPFQSLGEPAELELMDYVGADVIDVRPPEKLGSDVFRPLDVEGVGDVTPALAVEWPAIGAVQQVDLSSPLEEPAPVSLVETDGWM